MDPFPHIDIPDCLPQGLYSMLSDEFPIIKDKSNNVRGNLSAGELEASSWQEFLKVNRSEDFVNKIKDIFGIDENIDIIPDSLLSYNTPVKEVSSVRNVHLDNGIKVYSGLCYMKLKGDTAGGDLVLCGLNENKTVPYGENRVVIWENTIHSWHYVTERKVTPRIRRMVNIYGNISNGEFYKHNYSKSDNSEPLIPVIPK